MRIQNRFILLLTILSVITLGAFSAYDRSEHRLLGDLLKDKNQSSQSTFDKILILKNRSLMVYAAGWTIWTELIDMIQKGGDDLKAWGADNIDPYGDSFDFEYNGIFDLKKNAVYTFTKETTSLPPSFPPELFNLIHEKRLVQFFHETPQGLMEFIGATIHPSDDFERATEPRGYFIVGRAWGPKVIQNLATLTENDIKLLPADGQPPLETQSVQRGTISFARPLSDFRNTPLRYLKIESTSPAIRQFNVSSRTFLLLLLGFALTTLISFAFAAVFWVGKPLRRIARTLQTDNPDLIKNLAQKTSELGSIARLIERSFTQRAELIHEVRERQKAQESLKKLSLAVEQTADSVFITNKNAVIEYVNPSFEKLSGYSREEAIGKTPSILKSGRHDAAFYQTMRETINAGTTFRNTVTNKRKDATLFDVEKTITPIKNDQGAITHFVSIDKDVTSRREMEKSQRLSQLGKLISDISHEVNNPLQIISGRAELALLDLKDTDLTRECLQIITDQCQRAKNIILRVLQFSKPSRHELKAVDVARATENTIVIIEAQFRLSGIAVMRHFAPDLPPILADEKQVQEVLMNLLTNARDAIKGEGRITISAQRSGQFVELKIKDNGQGMEQGTLAHALEPFFTTKEKGTGLGLHICYNIVRGHGGDLKIESHIDLGTTVTLLWPIKA